MLRDPFNDITKSQSDFLSNWCAVDLITSFVRFKRQKTVTLKREILEVRSNPQSEDKSEAPYIPTMTQRIKRICDLLEVSSLLNETSQTWIFSGSKL